MKTSFRRVPFCLALIFTSTLLLPRDLPAQSFTTLYNFSSDANLNGVNGDGANPAASLIVAGDTVYGTTFYGGANGYGTVFKVNTNGTGFTALHHFAYADYDSNSNLTNADGVNAYGLALAGSTLYGVANQGGTLANGTIFKVNTDGTGFTLLHTFTAIDPNTSQNNDGGAPSGSLVLTGDTLYGTGANGGSAGGGVVFALNTNGSGFRIVAIFSVQDPLIGNTGGEGPIGGLLLSGTNLFGTCKNGGGGLLMTDNGTLFKVSTNGFGFAVLHTFSAATSSTNSDGANPENGLLLFGGRLYGTATYGGASGDGVVFALNTDGTGFTNLHSFSPAPYITNVGKTNSDGVYPNALTASGDTIYGTAESGGAYGTGTIFGLGTNGASFETLHSLSPDNQIFVNGFFVVTNSDGASPFAGLILSQGRLYGAGYTGGSAGSGTVFDLTLAPLSAIPLNIALVGGSAVLTWSNAAFSLQAAGSLTDTFTDVPNATSPYTNVIAGSHQFFRLVSR